jgi:Mn2+/Fe2+ NRAMP family transporter
MKENETIKNPPKGLLSTLGFLGPGLIIAADLIGSGELIATTLLGAKVGLILMWLILITFLLKFYFIIEMGKFYITTGYTPLKAMNRIPGPKLLNSSWINWILFFYIILQTFQSAGILGASGLALNAIVPGIDERVWATLIIIIAIIILMFMMYEKFEKFFALIVGAFAVITVIAVTLLQGTPFAVGSKEVLQGFTFGLPRGGAYVALSVFGIIGVEGAHCLMYGFWSLEKGYARYTGVKPLSAEGYNTWLERARGWTRVMKIDNYLSMAISMIITFAFYILGGSILFTLNLQPQGLECIKTISNIYTGIYGSWSYYLFMIGAFFVLYSTICSHIVFFPRLLADFFVNSKLIKEKNRDKWVKLFVPIRAIPVLLIYLFIRQPLALVLFGGILASIITPVVFWCVIYLSRHYTDSNIATSQSGRGVLTVCAMIITIITVILIYYNFII